MNYTEFVFGRLTTVCAQRGITFDQLAVICKLRPSTFRNIEKGLTKNLTLRTLHRIAVGLTMTVSELLDFEVMNKAAFEDE